MLSMRKSHQIVIAVCIALLETQAAAAQDKPDFIRKYESDGYPKSTGALKLNTTAGIPIPEGGKKVDSKLSVEAVPTTPQEIDALKEALRIVNASQKVKLLLSANSRLLIGGVLPQFLGADPGAPPRYLFTFYDYEKDRAVEAQVSKGEVVSVQEGKKGYQPPATDAELRAAAGVVGNKFMLGIRTEEVSGLAFAGADGRRKIFIHGASAGRATSAIVDLSRKQVLQFKTDALRVDK